MPEEPPQISILDARLAEIDRRLRTIQTGLAEDAGPSAAGPEHSTPRARTESPAGTEPAAAGTEPAAAGAKRSTPSVRGERFAPRPAAGPAVTPELGLPPRVAVPEADAQPRAGGSAAAGGEASEVVASLREPASVQEGLVDSMRGLLAAYERVLARSLPIPRPAPAPAPALSARPAAAPAPAPAAGPAPAPPAGPAPAASPRQVTVSAGPFASTDAVRGFERTLAGMPGVGEVEVRGYEGGDRAIVDVQLIDPTS